MAKKDSGKGKKMGLVGCGTPEIMFRQDVKRRFGSVEGVVGIEVKKDKIVLRVLSEDIAATLPKTYRRRKIETVVTGVIRKQAPRK